MKSLKEQAEEYCKQHQKVATGKDVEPLPAFMAEKIAKAKAIFAKVGLPKQELLDKLNGDRIG